MILNGIAEGISGVISIWARERKRPDVLSIKSRLGTKCGRSTFWPSAVCSSLHSRSLESVFRLCAVCAMRLVYLYKSRLVLLSPAAAHGEVLVSLCVYRSHQACCCCCRVSRAVISGTKWLSQWDFCAPHKSSPFKNKKSTHSIASISRWNWHQMHVVIMRSHISDSFINSLGVDGAIAACCYVCTNYLITSLEPVTSCRWRHLHLSCPLTSIMDK